MRTVAIIQARMTSTRLPGKVMLPLGNQTVLSHVLSRCKQIKGIYIVCCAIPVGSEHDVLVDEIKKCDVVVFRGSETNVLERYYEAAKNLNADVVMRITSDCPLINVDVCEVVLDAHITNQAAYTCNNMPPSWPHGYDCEVFNMEQLEDAMKFSTLPEDFEHVTPWIRRTQKVQNIKNPKGNEYKLRITLDTSEDYMFIKKYYNSNIDNGLDC